jgi:hypothetical protein
MSILCIRFGRNLRIKGPSKIVNKSFCGFKLW